MGSDVSGKIKVVNFKNKKGISVNAAPAIHAIRQKRAALKNAEDMIAQSEGYVAEMADEAGLDGLLFSLQNRSAERLVNGNAINISEMPSAVFTAEDGAYSYSINIRQERIREPENSVGANPGIQFTGGLIRKDKAKAKAGMAEEPYEAFDFTKREWILKPTTELFGATPKQMWAFRGEDVGAEEKLWRAYTNVHGPVGDERFEEIKAENSKLLELAEALSKGMRERIWFTFRHPDAAGHASMMLSTDYYGACVQFCNKTYCVRQFAGYERGIEPVRIAYFTKSLRDMADWLDDTFGRLYPSSTRAVIPLSEYAILVITKNSMYVEKIYGTPTREEARMANAAMEDMFGEKAKAMTDWEKELRK